MLISSLRVSSLNLTPNNILIHNGCNHLHIKSHISQDNFILITFCFCKFGLNFISRLNRLLGSRFFPSLHWAASLWSKETISIKSRNSIIEKPPNHNFLTNILSHARTRFLFSSAIIAKRMQSIEPDVLIVENSTAVINLIDLMMNNYLNFDWITIALLNYSKPVAYFRLILSERRNERRKKKIQLYDTKSNTRLKCNFRVLLNIICWFSVSLLITSSKKRHTQRAQYAWAFRHRKTKITSTVGLDRSAIQAIICVIISTLKCKFNILYPPYECARESSVEFLETLGYGYGEEKVPPHTVAWLGIFFGGYLRFFSHDYHQHQVERNYVMINLINEGWSIFRSLVKTMRRVKARILYTQIYNLFFHWWRPTQDIEAIRRKKRSSAAVNIETLTHEIKKRKICKSLFSCRSPLPSDLNRIHSWNINCILWSFRDE